MLAVECFTINAFVVVIADSGYFDWCSSDFESLVTGPDWSIASYFLIVNLSLGNYSFGLGKD